MSSKSKLPVVVNATLVQQFNRSHKRFIEAAMEAAPKMVKAINENRVMGILLKELLGRENITENCLHEWLRVNQAGPGPHLAETEVAWLMNFVRVSNKLQGELKLFADAPREVVQMTLQCAGLLPADAARTEVQTSHELTPSVQSWKVATDFKVKFEGMIKGAVDWDDATRRSVRDNIEKVEVFLRELKAKI